MQLEIVAKPDDARVRGLVVVGDNHAAIGVREGTLALTVGVTGERTVPLAPARLCPVSPACWRVAIGP